MPVILEKETYLVSEAHNPNRFTETYAFLREPMNIHGVTVVWDSLVRQAQANDWLLSVRAGNGFVWLECLRQQKNGRWNAIIELTVSLPESERGLPSFEFESI